MIQKPSQDSLGPIRTTNIEVDVEQKKGPSFKGDRKDPVKLQKETDKKEEAD